MEAYHGFFIVKLKRITRIISGRTLRHHPEARKNLRHHAVPQDPSGFKPDELDSMPTWLLRSCSAAVGETLYLGLCQSLSLSDHLDSGKLQKQEISIQAPVSLATSESDQRTEELGTFPNPRSPNKERNSMT